jgi:monodictyphenone polyketide synthase
VFAGLGIGLLVSTAVSLTPALENLPLVGAEVIRLAFRLGVTVAEISQNLEPFDEEGNSRSWAYVVHGVTPEHAQQELDQMYSRQVRSIGCPAGPTLRNAG